MVHSAVASHCEFRFILHSNEVIGEPEKSKSNRTHLVLSSMLHYLLIHNLIHDLETFDGLLLCDADVGLLQRHRAETAEETNAVIRGISKMIK